MEMKNLQSTYQPNDLTLSTSHSQIEIATNENDETFYIGKNKISGQGLGAIF